MLDNKVQTSTPTLTSANLPKPPVEKAPPSHELADGIVAKPLVQPNFIGMRPKNANLQFYWGNRSAGGGLRLEELLAKGFVLAKPEDINGCPEGFVKDGKVVYGDLILLKMDKATYLGALRHNHDKATHRASRQGMGERGKRTVNEEARNVSGSADLLKKISTFIPSQAETEGLVGKG